MSRLARRPRRRGCTGGPGSREVGQYPGKRPSRLGDDQRIEGSRTGASVATATGRATVPAPSTPWAKTMRPFEPGVASAVLTAPEFAGVRLLRRGAARPAPQSHSYAAVGPKTIESLLFPFSVFRVILRLVRTSAAGRGGKENGQGYGNDLPGRLRRSSTPAPGRAAAATPVIAIDERSTRVQAKPLKNMSFKFGFCCG